METNVIRRVTLALRPSYRPSRNAIVSFDGESEGVVLVYFTRSLLDLVLAIEGSSIR